MTKVRIHDFACYAVSETLSAAKKLFDRDFPGRSPKVYDLHENGNFIAAGQIDEIQQEIDSLVEYPGIHAVAVAALA